MHRGSGIADMAGFAFKDLVIRKFSEQSPDIVIYYYWLFPFGIGFSLYSMLESFAWQLNRSVITTYFREVQYRMFTILLVCLFYLGILKSFDVFVKLYSLSYLLLAFCLFIMLSYHKEVNITLKISHVTRRFFRMIVTQASLVWSGQMLYNLSAFFAQIVIAAVVPGGLKYVGIYTLAQYMASLIQAPQRGVIAASIGPLSQAWKDRDFGRIDRIYRRSSINQLIFSVALYILIWINFSDGVLFFHLKNDFLESRQAFFFIGLIRIVDMGTGVTNQIIGTSTYWRFDFFTGITLAALTLPLNYFLAKSLGYIGPAIADLITFTVYNGIRWVFLLVRFRMQPFTKATLYTLLLGGAGWFLCDYFFAGLHGLPGILARSLSFILIYGGGVLLFRLSEDVLPVWNTIKKRLGLQANSR
ncbi:lipopolysaccharide biosynthesis protein [Puia sp. P3]|uniref:lipopolysaccharide biosynthesis protein n=1 Tax=Puia sp. P3 TaxID=3423952 RepID=UPI003D6725B2